MSPIFLAAHPKKFPNPRLADDEGLIAFGADLSVDTLLLAYKSGIFPWYNEEDLTPILWWSPNPRCVINPLHFKASRSLQKTQKSGQYYITVDQCFEQVIRACAAPRTYADSTWINDAIIKSYSQLHRMGIAHSIETWTADHQLVGGLYGLNLGRLFFGESMFSMATDASKVAFAFLMRRCAGWQFPLVDCQLPNNHLLSLGAYTIPRDDFLTMLAQEQQQSSPNWQAWQGQAHPCLI
ncbi:leucyl/phenylalanyl-tRNA--protein transferase [Agitococcus lubricus]|uniref:Leucyl/phenylalanyl-tRNA--protein transferase n=1 Tax=Agitococcus lubricus TaxID=1077255 RepID=A0A2T5IZQ1_9GAMM|nr:leucyl/phenylalanyl-tRNA--protein transferase [Agitococcus lubricus]PTQ89513.1 leucyl/phenylalanyl-tRNA--protein transferase [Agitococcus lubricus]